MGVNIKLVVIFIVTAQFLNVHCVSIHIDPQTNLMMDDSGRVRIYHGVNAVYKIFPYYPNKDGFDPQYSLVEEDIQNLYDWGFNFVRLGTMWPGVAPLQGSYNYTYLNELGKIVNNLAKKDIHVLLDCHQDLLSPKFCGEGAPDWAIHVTDTILPFPYPSVLHELPIDPNTGYPDINACLNYTFAIFYFSMSTGSAFQSLYDNVQGCQNAFGDFWEVVAKYFKSYQNVIGYELINEPWPGDVYEYPDLVTNQGKADLEHLQPMYDYLSSRIRTADTTKLIFFEPTLIDYVHVSPGFTHVPGGPSYKNQSIFSYHIYCGDTGRNGEPKSEFLCEVQDDVLFDLFVDDYENLGGGGFITEWGNMPNNPVDVDDINYFTGACDNNLISWAWWQFKSYHDVTTTGIGTSESFYDQNGNLQKEKVMAMSRTYAYAIAGIPSMMNFNPNTNLFKLTYQINKMATKPTEIYLNTKWRYINGYTVTINPQNAATWKVLDDANHVAIIHAPSVTQGQNITITIASN
eukprot:TRINITY_DN5320_c0_g1_i1.p1 TRINITY_DN5320_c0_g1~~TRINITY_DN5320_c0_g1_i1.p1  ORF type:complete len:517 (-),score=117.21 TRINITY_DN5320_c0_g1_i1:100-1650(-)